MHAVFNFQGIPASLSVLMFLGGSLGAVALTLATVGFWLANRKAWAAGFAALGVLGAVVYSGLLLGASALSDEKIVPVGGEKYFCEIDCHLAYSVIGVSRLASLGDSAAALKPQGQWFVVRLRTRFDEATTSTRRSNSALFPNPRRAEVVDEQGRHFIESAAGVRALETTEGSRTPLTRELRPGESYLTPLVFDLPADSRNPRLLLVESDAITGFLVGHENSPGHRKAWFRLEG